MRAKSRPLASRAATVLSKLGGSAYVLENSAQELVAGGRFRFVRDTPVISQPVYAASHLRHRTSRLHRHLLQVVRTGFADPGSAQKI